MLPLRPWLRVAQSLCNEWSPSRRCPQWTTWDRKKNEQWVKVGRRYVHKVGANSKDFATKWLFTRLLKKLHNLITKLKSPRHLSVHKGGTQDHHTMKNWILGNVYSMLRWNEWKVTTNAWMQIVAKWTFFHLIAKGKPQGAKPSFDKTYFWTFLQKH